MLWQPCCRTHPGPGAGPELPIRAPTAAQHCMLGWPYASGACGLAGPAAAGRPGAVCTAMKGSATRRVGGSGVRAWARVAVLLGRDRPWHIPTWGQGRRGFNALVGFSRTPIGPGGQLLLRTRLAAAAGNGPAARGQVPRRRFSSRDGRLCAGEDAMGPLRVAAPPDGSIRRRWDAPAQLARQMVVWVDFWNLLLHQRPALTAGISKAGTTRYRITGDVVIRKRHRLNLRFEKKIRLMLRVLAGGEPRDFLSPWPLGNQLRSFCLARFR